MVLALLSAATLSSCQVDQAHYVLRTAPDVTADFRPLDRGKDWPSGLALSIRFSKSGRTYWFLPSNGGTDGVPSLVSTTDVDQSGWRPPDPDGGPRPLGDIEYLGMAADYRVIGHAP